MKKSNIIIIWLFYLALLGCKTSRITDVQPPFSPIRLELINLGETKEIVERKVGKANEIRVYKKDDLWIYDNSSSGTQIGSVTFSAQTGQVKGITFVPDLKSEESSLDFLKEKKFSHIQFEEIQSSRCQKDYIPTSIFYFSRQEGVIIRYNQHSQFVESYSKVQKSLIGDIINDIQKCN